MPGTKEGAAKAVKTCMAKHGKDFYKNIGRKGGSNGKGPGYKGGFAMSHEWAVKCGSKGGSISRRSSAKKNEDKDIEAAEKILEEESRN